MAIDRDAALKRAEKCLRQGKLDGAIEEYVRLVEEQPRDWGLVNSLGDLYVRAGDNERAVAQFRRIADFYFAEGFLPRAAAVYKKALKLKDDDDHAVSQLAEIAAAQELFADAKAFLRQLARQRRARGDQTGALTCLLRLASMDRSVEALDALVEAAELRPDDLELRGRIARECIAAGQVERARPYLTPETAGDDPDLLLAVAITELGAERDVSARALLTRLIALAPQRDGDLLKVAEEIAARGDLERAYGCVDIVVDTALLQGNLTRAIEVLQRFLRHGPHVPGLVKLVEISVDAGLEEPMRDAQARLADAYLEAGRTGEARVIAEDLVAWKPASDAHMNRLRRALEALGIADVDGALAGYVPTDVIDEVDLANGPAPEAPEPVRAWFPDGVFDSADIHDEPRSIDEPIVVEPLEIDLSAALADLSGTLESPVSKVADPPDLEEVFDRMRSVADREQQMSDAASLFERAEEDIRCGRADAAVAGLEAAARLPSLRFKAAAHLGRLYLTRGDLPQAVNWLERAAEAPAPTADEGFAVLHDLAAALEASGEMARALAILMELDSSSGGYGDIRGHIDRLSRAQSGGGRA